jgi:hypothetical protein
MQKEGIPCTNFLPFSEKNHHLSRESSYSLQATTESHILSSSTRQ